MLCLAAKSTDEGWECAITGGACMFALPDSKACAEKYNEGPDMVIVELTDDELYLNGISDEEIEKQGDLTTTICCCECSYSTGQTTLRNAIYIVNMQGGYFMYDGEGGPISKCPICGHDRLYTDD